MTTRTVPRDPEEVYQEILGRLREFAEGQIERQCRITKEWIEVQKGDLSALQFLPLFEAAVGELELAGLAKIQRELLLSYLDRMGAKHRGEVLKDVRVWDAEPVARGVNSWREAQSPGRV